MYFFTCTCISLWVHKNSQSKQFWKLLFKLLIYLKSSTTGSKKSFRLKSARVVQVFLSKIKVDLPILHQDLLASTTKVEEWNRIWTTTNRAKIHDTAHYFYQKNTKQHKQKRKDSHDWSSNRTLQDHTRIRPKQNRTTFLQHLQPNKSPPNTCYVNAENTET